MLQSSCPTLISTLNKTTVAPRYVYWHECNHRLRWTCLFHDRQPGRRTHRWTNDQERQHQSPSGIQKKTNSTLLCSFKHISIPAHAWDWVSHKLQVNQRAVESSTVGRDTLHIFSLIPLLCLLFPFLRDIPIVDPRRSNLQRLSTDQQAIYTQLQIRKL